MIDLRTPVAASRKSSSSETKPLARVKEETKPRKLSRERQNLHLTVLFSSQMLRYKPHELKKVFFSGMTVEN